MKNAFFQMNPGKSQSLYKISRLKIQKDGLGFMVLLLEGFQLAILTRLDLKKVIIYTCNCINTQAGVQWLIGTFRVLGLVSKSHWF